MAKKWLAISKGIFTRIIFSAHGFIAIFQVTQNMKDIMYWNLLAPIFFLFLEGIFTLVIKKTQEWRWFCPSVFLYLISVVPAIWLLELDKVERRLKIKEEEAKTATDDDELKNINKLLGDLEIKVDAETWVTLIEQFLMLVLILGRWMLPKGDLTRDQLSQLLLVYIGTAADIIEFFDSFKDSKIANEPILVLLTLGIWSWSLLQFTIVLSATRSRKPRGGGSDNFEHDDGNCCNNCCCSACCSIDVWGIALNIVLQDAPFLAFRLLIIIHYRIISYMNVFFTCKNTLVILLQLYRLYVVHSENRKTTKKKNGNHHHQHSTKSKQQNNKRNVIDSEMKELSDIYVISGGKHDRKRTKRNNNKNVESDEEIFTRKIKQNKNKHSTSGRKDTGYSSSSSSSSSESESDDDDHYKISHSKHGKSKTHHQSKKIKRRTNDEDVERGDRKKRKIDVKVKKKSRSSENIENETRKKSTKREKQIIEQTEESDTSDDTSEIKCEKKRSKNKKNRISSSSSVE